MSNVAFTETEVQLLARALWAAQFPNADFDTQPRTLREHAIEEARDKLRAWSERGSAGPSPAVRSEGGADDATAGSPRPPSDAPVSDVVNHGYMSLDAPGTGGRVDALAKAEAALAEATELLRDVVEVAEEAEAFIENDRGMGYGPDRYTHRPSADESRCDYCGAPEWPCPVERARRFLTRTGQPQ